MGFVVCRVGMLMPTRKLLNAHRYKKRVSTLGFVSGASGFCDSIISMNRRAVGWVSGGNELESTPKNLNRRVTHHSL